MSFRSSVVKIKYRSFIDDPINDFYIPILGKSVFYRRAVGYFSSSILLDYTKGLREFLKNSGTIQLIISPYLSNQDINSINLAYSESTTKQMTNELFQSYLKNEKSFASAKLLFILIKLGRLEIKVAEPKNTSGLFHDKIGLFYDAKDDKIAITGSNNETSSAVKLNIESFNTFCSWKQGQKEYVIQHELDFDNYWNGVNNTIKIYSLEQALDEDIIKEFETDENFDDLVSLIFDEIIDDIEEWNVTPYDFQEDAVDLWFKEKKGIFKFATGSGKTKTAIYLMEKIEREREKNFYIIVVPDKTLVNQWSDELESYNKKVIRCFSANPNWNKEFKDLIEVASIKNSYNYYIVVTNDSYGSEKFKRELKKLNDDYLLVVDECHTWGTENFLNSLPNPNMRLGLSATPELFFSQDKTDRLLSFFGGIVAEYSLGDAIRDERLVNYSYFPHFISLSTEEKEKYNELTRKIVKLIGSDIDEMNDRFAQFGSILELLLFARARVVYGAINKIEVLKDIVPILSEQKNLIIYCGPTSYLNETEDENEKDSLTQLETVNKLLGSIDIKFAQYTSKESELERKNAINSFVSGDYTTLVAIKCLDEGVNIPQIQKAIIMASSTNPREFIQRRGRILRTYPGKAVSEIHDLVVFDSDYPLLSVKEMTRVYEFSKLAINKDEMFNKFDDLQKEIFMEVSKNG